MIIIEKVLGNASDPDWAAKLAAGTVEPLALDHWEAQKNRFRKKTASGAEIAVSLDRGAFLRDGDVLVWDAASGRAVVARISLRDVMIIHLDELAGQPADYAMRTCVELGHALGNQHWPALVKDNRVFVPLTVDRKVMASVMNTHRFEGIRYEFVPGDDIVPYLAPHESRRLFGGAEGPVHTHIQDRYVAVDPETGRVHGRAPVSARVPSHVDADPRRMMVAQDGAAPPVTAVHLARLLQFGDSMLPIGGFSFSGGLESAIQQRVVTDAATLLAYARTAIDQANRGDGIGLVCAHRAARAGDVEELARIDALIYARKLSGETRSMSVRMGKKFTELAAHVTRAPQFEAWRARVEAGATPGCYPVALATSFAAQGLAARDAFAVHQYGVASTILGAALRLMRIGHMETQQMLYALNADVEAAYQRAAAAGLPDMAGFAPLAEILAAVHVKAHVRLFMN